MKLGLTVKAAFAAKADLRGAVLSGAYLSGAVLSGAVLSGADLRGAYLRGVDLSDADLRGAYLSGAYLRDADLSDAVLSGADLSGVYLSDADWIPKVTNIHQAVYAAASAPQALNMRDWHTCETTHCRAGWVCVLAGEGGKVLDRAYGTPAAAALIYMASDPTLERIPYFYASNADALADMKRLSDAEAARVA